MNRRNALVAQHSETIRTAQPVVSRGTVAAGKAGSSARVECRAAWSHIYTLVVAAEILVGCTSHLKYTLSVDDAVVSTLALAAESKTVDSVTVSRFLDTDSLDADFIALAWFVL